MRFFFPLSTIHVTAGRLVGASRKSTPKMDEIFFVSFQLCNNLPEILNVFWTSYKFRKMNIKNEKEKVNGKKESEKGCGSDRVFSSSVSCTSSRHVRTFSKQRM